LGQRHDCSNIQSQLSICQPLDKWLCRIASSSVGFFTYKALAPLRDLKCLLLLFHQNRQEIPRKRLPVGYLQQYGARKRNIAHYSGLSPEGGIRRKPAFGMDPRMLSRTAPSA
jgi:hypothetical protein